MLPVLRLILTVALAVAMPAVKLTLLVKEFEVTLTLLELGVTKVLSVVK